MAKVIAATSTHGDGDLDAFVANAGQANRVWLNESSVLFGDYNGNNVIDAADYTVWRDALAAGATTLLNDPTPGTVEQSDFLYWRDHFGETLGAGSGAASSVPEPTVTEQALADAAVTEEVEPVAVVSSEPLRAPASAASAERAPSAARAVDLTALATGFSANRLARRAIPASTPILPFYAAVSDDELLLLATAKAVKESTPRRQRPARSEVAEEPDSSDLDSPDDPLATVLLDWQ